MPEKEITEEFQNDQVGGETMVHSSGLGLNSTPEHKHKKKFRINWNAVGVITAIALAAISWLKSGAVDYLSLGSRVRDLEVQRVEDLRHSTEQRQEDLQWRYRVETKIDTLLERKR